MSHIHALTQTAHLEAGLQNWSLIILGAILLIDFILVIRRPHAPSLREASAWVFFYVALALLFALLLLKAAGPKTATEFVAGWLTEYSLSLDNLFVFVIILASFKVPPKYQQRALLIGIVLALLFRGLFILAGAVLIEQFNWIFYIFGAWLIWTALQQAKPKKNETEKSLFVSAVKRLMPYTDEFHGTKLRTKISGKWVLTPLMLVFIALGATDILFALDSIPAIFGITSDPYIVFTANIFALMGLRQLFFLLGALLEKLVYLKYAIACILAFIGVKLVLHALHENEVPFINNGKALHELPELDTLTSLSFIVAAMIIATTASLWRLKHENANSQKPPRLGAPQQ